MVSKGGDQFVLWPRYFDARVARADGRRVPVADAVKDPDAKWIYSAARKAGFTATIDDDAKDPAVPHKVVGRVLIAKQGSKEAVIQAVGKAMATRD